MCDGYSWVYYAAAAAAAAYGANAQAEATNDAADRQAKAMADALEQQDVWSRKAEEKAIDNAQEYDMTDRTQKFEDTRQAAGESLAQSLIKSREQSTAPDQAAGRLSETFTTDRADKLSKQFQESVDTARLMGKMRGTQDMLGNEAIQNADYASQMNTIGRNARGDLASLRPTLELAGKVDANKVATGALMKSLGTQYLAGGLGSAFGSTASAGADVGNGVGNANLMGNGNSVGSYANLKMM